MSLSRWAITVAATVLLGASAAHAAPQYFPHAVPAGAKAMPFSDAVLVGDTLYVSGHIGIDARTGVPAGDAAQEARVVLDSVQATLKGAGLTMDDLVSVTVYCTDLALFETFNSSYVSYFHGQLPARAFVGVATLLRGARYEVQGIAVRPPARR